MDDAKPPPRGVGPPSGKQHGGEAKGIRAEQARVGSTMEVKRDLNKEQDGNGEQHKTARSEKEQRGGEEKGAKRAWGNPAATKALLFAPAPSTAQYDDERKYAEEYACARKPHDVVASDACRPMTALGKRTLYLWRKGILRLASPPAFTNETHTLNQRTRNLQVQRDHPFARLYILLNPGQKLRRNGAKWHFCNAMLGLNAEAEASSPLVEFFFVRKEHRDQWAGKTLKLPGGVVTLHATDSFSKEGKGASYDKVAMELLHEYRFSGGDYAKPSVILAIARAISKGMAVHSLRTEDPTGKGFYNNQVWIATLDSTVGPEELIKIREIVAICGQVQYKLGLHQPRLARHPPCHTCLDDNHPRHKCPLAEPTKENLERREAVRAPRQLFIDVEEPFAFPIAVPDTEEAFLEMQEREFARLEPDIMKARKAEATAAAAAAAAEIETAKAELLQLETEKEARKVVDVTAAAAAQKGDGDQIAEGAKSNGTSAALSPADEDTKDSSAKGKRAGKKKPRVEGTPRNRGSDGGATTDADAEVDTRSTNEVRKSKAATKEDRRKGMAAVGEQAEAEAKKAAAKEAAAKQAAEAKAKADREAQAIAHAHTLAEAEAKRLKEEVDAKKAETKRMEDERKKKSKEAELAKQEAAAASEEAKRLEMAAQEAEVAAKRAAIANREAADEATASGKRAEAQDQAADSAAEENGMETLGDELADRAASELAAKLHAAMQEAMQEAVKAKAITGHVDEGERTDGRALMSPEVSSLARAVMEATRDDTKGQMTKGNGEIEEGGTTSSNKAETATDTEQSLPPARLNADGDEEGSARAAAKRGAGEQPDEAIEEAGSEEEERTTGTDGMAHDAQSALCVTGGTPDGKVAKKRAERAEKKKAHRQARQALKATKLEKEREQAESRHAALLDRLAGDFEDDGFDFDESESDSDDFEPRRPRPDLESRPVGQTKGKRTRVDTADDPSTTDRPTAQPETRQARTMTAHEHVVSTTSEKFIAAVRERAATKKATGGTPGKQKTQLSVAAFLQKVVDEDDPMGDGSGEEKEDPAEGKTEEEWTDEQWRLARLNEFLKKLDLHEVVTPSNGSCLAYACHAMKAANLDAHEIPATRKGLTEAAFYRKQLALYIIDHFDALIGTSEFPLSEASLILLGSADVSEDTKDKIIAHLRKDARQCCKTVCGREYWGTELHIRGLVHWGKEPVYVCTVMPEYARTKWEIAVQRYSFDRESATVQTEKASVADTARCLKIYHANKVLPLILVLRVGWTTGGELTSHFNGARVHQEHYQAWSGSKRQAAAMSVRLRHVEEEIRSQRLGTPVEVDVEAVYRSPEDDVSLYEPSSTEEDGEGVETQVEAKKDSTEGKVAAQATSERAKEDVVDLTSLSEVRSVQASEPEVSITSSGGRASPLSDSGGTVSLEGPGSPATQLTPKELERLLLRLGDVDDISRTEWIYQLLHKAEVANRMAYAEWQRTADKGTKAKHSKVMGHLTPTVVCVATSDDATALLPLLHVLPYTQVLLATLDRDVLWRIGEAVECEGHRQMLRRLEVEPRIDDAARAFCKQWADAIEHLPPLSLKRRESEKLDSWHRLRHRVKQKARTPMSPERIAQSIPRNEWLHVLALAAALPQHFPQDLQSEAPERFCDELLYWLTRNGQIDYTKGVGIALVSRQWGAIEVIFGADEVAGSFLAEWYKSGHAHGTVHGPDRS